MESNETAEKMLCVLRKNISKITFEGYFLRYQDYKNLDIRFNLYNEHFPSITEPVKIFGITIYHKTIKESYYIQKGRLSAWSNGINYEHFVDIEVFNEMFKQVKDAKEAKFIKDLNKSCNGKKQE